MTLSFDLEHIHTSNALDRIAFLIVVRVMQEEEEGKSEPESSSLSSNEWLRSDCCSFCWCNCRRLFAIALLLLFMDIIEIELDFWYREIIARNRDEDLSATLKQMRDKKTEMIRQIKTIKKLDMLSTIAVYPVLGKGQEEADNMLEKSKLARANIDDEVEDEEANGE